jgi:hypothetical protein
MTDIEVQAIRKIIVEIPDGVIVWSNVKYVHKQDELNKLVVEIRANADKEEVARYLINATVINLKDALLND